MLLQGRRASESGLEAALCSALSWRPGAFRGRSAGLCGVCVQPRRPEGLLRSGSRRPISRCGRGTPRRGVGPAPSAGAGARTRRPTERSESGREHERGLHGMARGPGQEEWALVARRAAEEAARRRSRSRSIHGKTAISPLRSPLPGRQRRRPTFICAPCVTPPLCDVTYTSGQSPGGFHRCAPRANCGAVFAFSLQSGPAPLPSGSLRPWGAGRCI